MRQSEQFKSATLGTAIALALTVSNLAADEVHSNRLSDVALVHAFYDALPDHAVGANVFETLLERDARIELRDLDIGQTRQEFIDSLDEVRDALGENVLVYRVEPANSNDTTSALVCYDFGSNKLLVREAFTIKENRIAGIVQTGIGDDCGAL